jgi:hypothetical protein
MLHAPYRSVAHIFLIYKEKNVRCVFVAAKADEVAKAEQATSGLETWLARATF